MFKPGMYVRILFDHADGAVGVENGDIGIVSEHDQTHHNVHIFMNNGWIPVKFEAPKQIAGAYGMNYAVFRTSSLAPVWTDEQLFE